MPIVLPESLQSSFLPESKPHKSQHINLQLRRPLKFLSHFIKASTKRKPIILLSATMTSLPPILRSLMKKKKFFHRHPWVTDNIESAAGQKPIRPQSTHIYFQSGSFSDIKLVALMFLLQDFLIRNSCPTQLTAKKADFFIINCLGGVQGTSKCWRIIFKCSICSFREEIIG